MRRRGSKKILGIIVRMFEIKNISMHKKPLPMAELMTDTGLHVWKRRKLQVISESR
jgi:hypothetical protein